jgi:hypothetical protein
MKKPLHPLLAELEATTRGPDTALALIDQALAIAEETEQHLSDPYLHGLRGEFLLRRDPSNPGPAQEALQTGLEIAKQQGARSWGLRAALSLAKLFQSTARPAEAHAILAPALEGLRRWSIHLQASEARERASGDTHSLGAGRNRRTKAETA